jgi:hypothetical protein
MGRKPFSCRVYEDGPEESGQAPKSASMNERKIFGRKRKLDVSIRPMELDDLASIFHTFPSHSDANLLWAAGVKPILLGPGQLEHAHAPEERVSFPQVLQAAEIYLDLMTALE